MTRRDVLGILAFLGLVAVTAALGSVYTSMSIPGWYGTLPKPDWTPPAWVFGPVWTTLYLLMAAAGWLVWRPAGFRGARLALTLFVVQLAFNVGWSLLFFGMRQPALALAEIVVLWLVIVWTMIVFWRHRPLAGMLFVPYVAWVAFAGVLNAAIVG
ncbi:MAG TPA: TspO/MBR family protein [Longimicrobiales bacterium]|nr:TspO/MBR family protein [Longimicrobiales bacterium]